MLPIRVCYFHGAPARNLLLNLDSLRSAGMSFQPESQGQPMVVDSSAQTKDEIGSNLGEVLSRKLEAL